MTRLLRHSKNAVFVSSHSEKRITAYKPLFQLATAAAASFFSRMLLVISDRL